MKTVVNNKNSDEPVKSGGDKRVFLRRLFKVLVPAFCLWLFFVLVGRGLRHIAIGQISELTNTKITTKSVDFNFDGSVVIENLIIGPYQEQQYDDAILKAKKVHARFGIVSLLLLHPRLKKISVNDFVVDAQYDLDTGRWNVASLKIKVPKGDIEKMPIVDLEGGTLQYSKVSNGKVKVAASVPLKASFGFDEETQDGYKFEITTATMASGFGKSRLIGYWKPGSITIAGGISSADVPALEMTWVIDVLAAELEYDQNNNYSLELIIQDLRSKSSPSLDKFASVGPSFFGKSGTFTALRSFFNRYQPRGQVDIALKASGNFGQLSERALAGTVYCKDVSICDSNFPYVIEQLIGEADFTESGLELKNLTGRHNDVNLAFNGWSQDFGPNWQYQIQITSDNLALDNDLYKALSTKQKKSWSAFSPGGVAAINYCLYRQPQTDEGRMLAVKLLNAEAAYRRFPYPLKNLTGELFFDEESIVVSDLVSQLNERTITFNGKVTERNTERPRYDVLIKANNIPLDSTLSAALPAEQRHLYSDLDMRGLADADVKIFTPEQGSDPSSYIADVSLTKASLTVPVLDNSKIKTETSKVEQNPLVISDISAKTVFAPGLIGIENLTGRYCERLISLTGLIWPGEEDKKPDYCLSLQTEQVELNDDLIGMLPEAVKVPILQKGRKALENVVSKLEPKGKVNLSVNLNRGKRDDCPDCKLIVDCLNNSVNFKPFPYPLKDITGRLTITTDSIVLEDITATAVDNIESISNTKLVNLNGEIALADNAFSNGWFPPSAGDITLTAESLKMKGKTLTNLRADIYYDPDQESWGAKNLIADCYGGRLAGKVELRKPVESSGEYVLQLGFDNIDLKQFLLDTKSDKARGNRYTSGRVNGSLSVRAAVGDNDWRIGRCRLSIGDMHVGKLSPLVKLLQLKLTESEYFAFDRMLVDSYIKNDRLFLKQVDLAGEDMAFTGSGWMDLRSQNVDLILFSRGHHRLATAEPSVLQSLAEGLGGAVVRMEITGNFYDPHVETKTLPVIKDSLQILGTRR